MKKLVYLAALALLFACTPESNPGNGGNNNSGGNTQPTVVDLTGIALTEHEITLEKGGNKVLEVKFTPSNATNKSVTWVSSNTSIATVTDGIVVGVAPGSTEIIVKSGNFIDKCQVMVVISAASVSMDLTELTLPSGETATLKATVLPEDSTDEVEWSSSDETVASVQDGVVTAVALGEATITAKAGEKMATCEVMVKNPVPVGAVDLGLSVYWATCNIGASKPEDYGDYFAWGETEPKEDYSLYTYKWYNGSANTLTKYNNDSSAGTVDNKTVLEPEDDVAHVKLGGKWRMPTDAEWTELSDNCSWLGASLNGVYGCFVLATNGNSIFIPAAGWRKGTDLDASVDLFFWSSSLGTGDPFFAPIVHLYPDYVNYECCSWRFLGLPVRPVSE